MSVSIFYLFHSVSSTSHFKQMSKTHFIQEYHLTSTQAHPSSLICDQTNKKIASWSQWLVQSNRSASPVSSIYSQTGDDTRCVHWRPKWRTGKGVYGLRWPPERECWLIYQKGCDLTISKIRVGADHRGGVAIPDWTNHSRSHTQEAAVLVNSTKWGVWPYRFYGLVQRGLFQLQLTFLILVKVISTLRGEREMKRDKEDDKLEQSKHSL